MYVGIPNDYTWVVLPGRPLGRARWWALCLEVQASSRIPDAPPSPIDWSRADRHPRGGSFHGITEQ